MYDKINTKDVENRITVRIISLLFCLQVLQNFRHFLPTWSVTTNRSENTQFIY